MRWLKHTISIVLLLGAVGVILATAFSDHSDDYGQVSLPQGGIVHLPEGKVTVYDRVHGEADPDREVAGLSFAVTPAGGGEPIAQLLPNGVISDTSVTRSETIGEHGAFAKLDVPAAGDYDVTGESGLAPGSVHLNFGTNAGAAVLDRWKLIAGLLVGALLIALIPVPRRSGRRWEGDSGGWSSDPRAPYAG